MKPDPEKDRFDNEPIAVQTNDESEPSEGADEVSDGLREMMQAAAELPLPEHLLSLLDELEEEERNPPPKSADGRLRG
jgi:hypothetical protein